MTHLRRWGAAEPMIYTTQNGESFDTDKDFSGAERHVLQKLILWRDLAPSLEKFRRQKEEALSKGWGDSGPVQESRNLKIVIRDLEAQVARRLAGGA